MNKILIAAYILITALSIHGTGISAGEPVNNSWLTLDKNLLSSADYLFKTEIKTIQDIISFSSFRYDKKEDRNIGFNYRLIHLQKYGGYSTLKLVILVDEKDEVIMYKIKITSDKIVWGKLAADFAYSSIRNIKLNEKGLSLIIKNEIPCSRLKNEFAEYFGNLNIIEIPEKIKPEYELLTEPLNEIAYGAICGGAGLQPEGKEAIDKILKYGNKKIIENILISYNPAGRLYAIEALFSKNVESLKIKNSYSTTVDNIMKFNVPVLTCLFCSWEYYDISKIQTLYGLIRTNLSFK